MEINLIKQEPVELDHEVCESEFIPDIPDIVDIVDIQNLPGEYEKDDIANETLHEKLELDYEYYNSGFIPGVDIENLVKVTEKDAVIANESEKLEKPSDHAYQEITCTICSEKCRFELFKIHGMLHQKTNLCLVCKRAISKDFIGHVRRLHLENKCSVCDKVFQSPKSLKKHKQLHSNHDFPCDHCDKSFRSEGSLKVHVQYTHLGVKSFVCEICESPFINSSSLRRHVRRIHSTERKNEVYECTICFETLPNIRSKQLHELAHVSKKACDECGKTFGSHEVTRNHLKSRHYNTEKCPHCSRMLHKTMLESHIKNVHPQNTGQNNKHKFVCSICCKELSSADSLRKHRFQHEINRQVYSCSQCYKTYTRKFSLRAHIMRVHLGLVINSEAVAKRKRKANVEMNVFVCEICEVSFSHAYLVEKHKKKIHPDPPMNEGNYKCTICFESLPDSQEKILHELAHVSSMTCAICSDTFATVDAIRKHLKSKHYNTEKCSHCNEILHKTMLDSHNWREHRFVECKICHLTFKHYGLLARHNWVHEGLELCELCGCTLNFLNKERHMNLHRQGRVHRCNICKAIVSDLKKHIVRVHRNTEYFFCSRCPEKFITHADRFSHYRKTHSAKSRICIFCKLKFKTLDELKKHQAAEHKSSSSRHKKSMKLKFSHLGSTYKYKCDNCGIKFRVEDTLRKHKCRSGQYYCHLCDVRYTNKAYVKHHMITYHSPRINRDEKSEDKLEKDRLRQISVMRKKSISLRKEPARKSPSRRSYCQECGFSSFGKREMRVHVIRKHIMVKDSVEEGSDKVDVKFETEEAIYLKTEVIDEILDD